MGKTSNGTFRVPGGLEVNNNKPVDDRFVVETDADLLVDTNADGTLKTTELYKGIIVYSEESETHYVWNGLDRTNVENWLPINGSGGSGGDKNYVYQSNTPTTSWTINHGLQKGVSVTILDDTDSEVIARVVHVDLNTVRIEFNDPFVGKAHIN